MSFSMEQLKQQLSLLKEVIRMMTPEQKKEFAIFWMLMYKEMFEV